ncbi:hypothetical protein BN341_15180 [Helicobacter heilmannii ASB1.4]|nr:hypothetical protein BN341_15180 [Helicobacter heilmannii ASB1.4]
MKGFVLPKKMSLNCTIPALVKSKEESWGTRLELGTCKCPKPLKYSKNAFLSSMIYSLKRAILA